MAFTKGKRDTMGHCIYKGTLYVLEPALGRVRGEDVQYGDIDIDQWRGGLIQQHVTAPTAIQEDNMSNAYSNRH